ncbi:hypothetical protein [Methylobacterium sp. Leaf117]|uniref:hypothetical protein n=1 Tax=Methylobacterium sp. Leaf117 TaxID=1736260 RepID=UPI0007021EAC|nr:hypothetical protein [Methylobacterium sp. Leaf117]KQP91553.1 hypothetical protein ASF57_23065 [Methylobacterium sp. Leaf117]
MFHAAMQAAIEGARTLAQMDELSRQLWQGHGAGALGDHEAQILAERLHGRRSAIREGIRPTGIPAVRSSLFPPRRSLRSPDRTASLERRRLLACSGPLPPQLAARFTEGQRAVLRIVGDEVAAKGVCGLCIDAIAARAGVCRRLAQGALRLAAGDGLVTIEERRHQGRKNSPNLVRVISREWQAWIRRGGTQKRGGFALPAEGTAQPKTLGCKALRPTDKGITLGMSLPTEPAKKLPERQSLAHR